jgi:hypothetical protein
MAASLITASKSKPTATGPVSLADVTPLNQPMARGHVTRHIVGRKIKQLALIHLPSLSSSPSSSIYHGQIVCLHRVSGVSARTAPIRPSIHKHQCAFAWGASKKTAQKHPNTSVIVVVEVQYRGSGRKGYLAVV